MGTVSSIYKLHGRRRPKGLQRATPSYPESMVQHYGPCKTPQQFKKNKKQNTQYWRERALRAERQNKTNARNGDFFASRQWKELRYQALKLSNGCCELCGSRAGPGRPLHVDHIQPRSRFPELELSLSNLQVLCADCNYGKSNKDKTDWRKR